MLEDSVLHINVVKLVVQQISKKHKREQKSQKKTAHGSAHRVSLSPDRPHRHHLSGEVPPPASHGAWAPAWWSSGQTPRLGGGRVFGFRARACPIKRSRRVARGRFKMAAVLVFVRRVKLAGLGMEQKDAQCLGCILMVEQF